MEVELYCCYSLPLRNYLYENGLRYKNDELLISRGEKTMNKLIYYIKQLLPLKYHSKYRLKTGEKYLAIWSQWFGKPFNIERFKLAD